MLISIEVERMEYDFKKDIAEWEKRHPVGTYDRATGILNDAKFAPKIPKWMKA